jgi:hypothetical protein
VYSGIGKGSDGVGVVLRTPYRAVNREAECVQ